MPIALGATNFSTLADLISQAQAAGAPWQPEPADAFLQVLLPGAARDRLVEEGLSTQAMVLPTASDVPGGKTLVVPLRPGKLSEGGRISLGRASVCDVVVPFPALSKVHAYLTRRSAPEWTLEDAGSKNGTWLNAVRLAAGEVAKVADGAELKLGDVEMTFWMRATLIRDVLRQAKDAQR